MTYINMQKKTFMVLITLTLLNPTIYGLMDETEIKKKAEKYASYDEVIAGVECFTYEGETYWMICYLTPGKEKRYMILNNQGEPVYNKETLEAVTLENTITHGFNESRVKEYLKISGAYQESARTISSLSNSLKKEYESMEIRDSLRDMGNSYTNLQELFNKNAASLNKSLTAFSPQNAIEHMGYLNQTISEMETAIDRNNKAIKELNQITGNKTIDETASRSIDFLSHSKVNEEILLSALKKEKEGIQEISKNNVDEMLRRIKAKEREPFTIPLLFLTIITVIILVSTLHLWR
ncbi:MAG: hypothetical protein U9M95_05745 [Candidatus Altiarchaeota archaeon]|nr:hypothetical protein [Candidatus Altiarchaeota archaeon]